MSAVCPLTRRERERLRPANQAWGDLSSRGAVLWTLPRELASVPAGTGGTGVTRFASAAALLPVIRTLEPHAYPPGRSDFMRRAEPSPPGRHSVRYPLRQIRECASSTFPRNRITPPARHPHPRPGPAGPGALVTGDAASVSWGRGAGIDFHAGMRLDRLKRQGDGICDGYWERSARSL